MRTQPTAEALTHDDLLTTRAASLARQLELFARVRVEGFLKSMNPSKMKGHSTDFMQHRAYMPGDDIRNLDWRVFARSDRLVTREYEEFTNLDVILALDVSGSMGYHGQGMSKIDFCRHCAALLCYLLNGQRDRFALTAFADKVADFVPPSTGRKHMANLFRRMCALSTQGETDFAAGVTQWMRRIHRKSVFLIFSDCFQNPGALTRAVGMLRLQGHDVILYQVVDPSELDLQFPGFTLFRDLEDGRVDAADPMEIRNAYREVVDTHTRDLARGCLSFGGEFRRLEVGMDWDLALARLLRERAAGNP